jgi:hypothetical protein
MPLAYLLIRFPAADVGYPFYKLLLPPHRPIDSLALKIRHALLHVRCQTFLGVFTGEQQLL